MQIEITEKKVFMAVKGVDQPVPVGTIIEVNQIPGSMVGKCRVIGDPSGKQLLTGDSELETLRVRFLAVTGAEPNPRMKVDTLRAKIEEAEAAQEVIDLDNLKTEFLELTGELPADSLGVAELKDAIEVLKAS